MCLCALECICVIVCVIVCGCVIACVHVFAHALLYVHVHIRLYVSNFIDVLRRKKALKFSRNDDICDLLPRMNSKLACKWGLNPLQISQRRAKAHVPECNIKRVQICWYKSHSTGWYMSKNML